MKKRSETLREEIDRLQKELIKSQRLEHEEHSRRLQETPLKWMFTLRLMPPARFGAPIYDPCVTIWSLIGSITNRADAEAAGYSEKQLKGGSAEYLYNGASRRIIQAIIGGIRTNFVIGEPWYDTKYPDLEDQAIRVINGLGEAITIGFDEKRIREAGDEVNVTDLICGQKGFTDRFAVPSTLWL